MTDATESHQRTDRDQAHAGQRVVQVHVGDYGADPHGLICGYLFRSGESNQSIDAKDAQAWLPSPAREGFAWLHFNLAHASAETWLRGHAGLRDDFFAALHEGSRSSRIERDGDTLFAVINDVTYHFSIDGGDISTLWVSARESLVVTVRRDPLRAVDRLRADVQQGHSIDSTVDLLRRLLRYQADELQQIVRSAGERVDDIEDQLIARRGLGHAAELVSLRRLAVRLHRLLTPEPTTWQRVLADPPRWVPSADVQRLREAGDDFGVALRDVATLQDRIRLLQDEASARVAEENNRSLFLLTMVTVLALPINLTAGLLGMNVGGVPFGHSEHGFWIVVTLIVLVTLVAARVLWRRLGSRSRSAGAGRGASRADK